MTTLTFELSWMTQFLCTAFSFQEYNRKVKVSRRTCVCRVFARSAKLVRGKKHSLGLLIKGQASVVKRSSFQVWFTFHLGGFDGPSLGPWEDLNAVYLQNNWFWRSLMTCEHWSCTVLQDFLPPYFNSSGSLFPEELKTIIFGFKDSLFLSQFYYDTSVFNVEWL